MGYWEPNLGLLLTAEPQICHFGVGGVCDPVLSPLLSLSFLSSLCPSHFLTAIECCLTQGTRLGPPLGKHFVIHRRCVL